jgi:hypothetical protein
MSGGDIATPMANSGYPGKNDTKTKFGKLCQKDGELILWFSVQGVWTIYPFPAFFWLR